MIYTDTSKLKVMLETVRLGSVRKAAKRLGYTQAGLIYLLNRLEEDIGFSVLDRTHSGICFNERGLEMRPYFTALLDADAAMQSHMADLSRSVRAKVRIGSYASIAVNLLPPIIKQFQEQNPNIDVQVTVGVPNLIDMLEKGMLDFVITEEAYAGEYDWTPIWEDEVWAAVRYDHPLAKYDVFPLSRLLKEPIVFPSINIKNVVAVKLEEMGESANLDKNVVVQTSEGITVLYMTDAGLGSTFVSKLWLNQCPMSVVMRPVKPAFVRELGIVSKPSAVENPAVKKFMNLIKKSADVDVYAKKEAEISSFVNNQ